MPKQYPFVYRRGDMLAFRISVPVELRPLVGCRELVRSLGTSDKDVAGPYALEFAATAKRLFTDLRNMADKDEKKFTALINQAKTKLLLDEQKEYYEQQSIEQDRRHKEAIRVAAIQAENKALKRILATSEKSGIPNPTSAAEIAAKAHSEPSVPTFKIVVDDFLGKYEKRGKPAMLKKHRPVLAMLLRIVGDKPITQLRQADINDFFELIEKLPPRWQDACRKTGMNVRQLAEVDHDITLGPKSFEDTYLASVRAFLKSAKKDWQDQGFPLGLTTEGIEYLGDREEGENKQRAFKPDELKRLFEGSEFRAFAADHNRQHCYWLPMIGLYTGARVNEICQLNPQADILQDRESGIWYFWINKETEADPRVRKSVKTGDARKVPIHNKLIELGFLDYVARINAIGSQLLFPQWEPLKMRASGNAEKWFRQFLKDIGLRDETPKQMLLGMHAFRHTILTYGAMQKPPLSLFCITGHAQDEAPIRAIGAGKGYLTLSMLSPLSMKAKALNDLDYKLNLPMVVPL